jgi:hypothetical protein
MPRQSASCQYVKGRECTGSPTGCPCAPRADHRGHSMTEGWAVNHLWQTVGWNEYWESSRYHGWTAVACEETCVPRNFSN